MITLSVGKLVNLICRSGNIDTRFGMGDRTEEGKEVHRILQSAYGEGWEKEVALKKTFDVQGIMLQGRADGVFDRCKIHEIKSTRRSIKEWDGEGMDIHWAQAYCYAFLLAEMENLSEVDILLTYYNLKSEERRDITRTLPVGMLRDYVEGLIEHYAVWNRFQMAWIEKRTASLLAVRFPYGEFRGGQRKLAAAVYTAVRDGFNLIAEAPTGVGKTISVLFPALKAMGEDRIDKVFYLTAKAVARTVAEEAARDLRQAGGFIKLVTLTAKDKICFTGERKCNPVDCAYALGHFDRINDCIFDVLSTEDHMDREHVIQYAQKHRVCPFELSFDLAMFSDVIICDYNYVFDPQVKIQRFFTEVSERYSFLVDEGHNLPQRARDMYSAVVCHDNAAELRKAYPKSSQPHKALGKLVKLLKECGDAVCASGKPHTEDHAPPSKLCFQIQRVIEAAYTYGSETEGFELSNGHSDLLADLYRFDLLYDIHNEGHRWIETADAGGTGRLLCVDPSELLGRSYLQAVSTVVFSATMAPYRYFEDVLGLSGCKRLVIDSPFPKENRLMVLGGGVDTRMAGRENAYQLVADYIASLVSGRRANYLVFFPSYDFMNRICTLLDEKEASWCLHPQVPGMTEAEKEKYLSVFQSNGQQTVIGLAVLGGSFSEGIDLSGNRLEGVAVVGFGTPYVNTENLVIQRYYDEAGKDGYTYSFVYPAINKVVQAVGRLIRTENDKGMVLFLDDRYVSPRYRLLLPKDWSLKRLKRPSEVSVEHMRFWGITEVL